MAARAATVATVRFEAAGAHVFSGLGAQIWAVSPHQTARDRLMRALDMRDVRVSIVAQVADDRLDDHASVPALVAAMQATRTPDGTRILDGFRDEMAALGVAMDFVYWGMPQKWTDAFGPPGHRQWRCVPAHIPDYANWIAAQLLFAREFGLRPAAVELTNEPDGGWNTYFTPQQYGELVQATRRTMDENGLRDILIEGPGTSKVYDIGPYLAELISSGRLTLLGRVSVHDYDTIADPGARGPRRIAAELAVAAWSAAHLRDGIQQRWAAMGPAAIQFRPVETRQRAQRCQLRALRRRRCRRGRAAHLGWRVFRL